MRQYKKESKFGVELMLASDIIELDIIELLM